MILRKICMKSKNKSTECLNRKQNDTIRLPILATAYSNLAIFHTENYQMQLTTDFCHGVQQFFHTF